MVIIGRVIFVHGVGVNITKEYWKEWSFPVMDGLKRQGLKLTVNNFDGVYYADIFSNLNKSDPWQEEEKVKFLLQLKYNVKKEMSRQVSFYSRGFLNELINEGIRLFGQIFYYFYNEDIYREVNNRLYIKLLAAKGSVHLIGFSLGSLISFCALQQDTEIAKKVQNFIMVGSPLFWVKHGMKSKADLKVKPAVNYFNNVAGKLDIAMPQVVPLFVTGLDEQINVTVNKFNPIEGHMSYFKVTQSIDSIAKLIKKYYYD